MFLSSNEFRWGRRFKIDFTFCEVSWKFSDFSTPILARSSDESTNSLSKYVNIMS